MGKFIGVPRKDPWLRSVVGMRDVHKFSVRFDFTYNRSSFTIEQQQHQGEGRGIGKMSAKYAFSNTLKEVRFLFCQTGEHSGATRFVYALFFPSSMA
jgi:hypothetical protein